MGTLSSRSFQIFERHPSNFRPGYRDRSYLQHVSFPRFIARQCNVRAAERAQFWVNRYANELRYALVYAVFVEPIEIQTYNLPFAIRTPRPVKFTTSRMIPFNIELQKSLRKHEIEEKSKKSQKIGNCIIKPCYIKAKQISTMSMFQVKP